MASTPSLARRVAALVAPAVALLSGCGASMRNQPPVSPAVVRTAEASILTVRCANTNPYAGTGTEAIGTGFATDEGIVTAAHVVSTCAAGGPGSAIAGPLVVSVSVDDPTHDLALMEPRGATPVLSLHAALPSPGASVALLGAPGNATEAVVQPVAGTVLATGTTVTLTSERGTQETLHDAIEVRAGGAVPGYSGGPAIDAEGRVIGVVEGSGGGRAYLTPAADVASLRGAG